MYYKVGAGKCISICKDPWVPSLTGFKPIFHEGLMHTNDSLKISDLIEESGT